MEYNNKTSFTKHKKIFTNNCLIKKITKKKKKSV